MANDLVELQFDPAGLFWMLEREDGELMRDLRRRAQNVVREARRNARGAPVPGATNPEGRGPNWVTRNLYHSIYYVIVKDAQGKYAEIGSDVEYAYYLETGVRGTGNIFPFLTPALSAIND